MCRHLHAESVHGSCGRPSRAWHRPQPTELHHYHGDPQGPRFGVRRPLRFLAWKLKLDERQMVEFATILNELKTERAQAEVDDRRALAMLADAAQGETFERAKADEAAKLRTDSAERLQRKVVESLARIHAQLDLEQRERLAYHLRTGTLVV